MALSRRDLLRAAAVASTAAVSPPLATTAAAQPLLLSPSSELMPRSGKRRVVICGGGWGGMSAARHVREAAPELEVVMLERNPHFWSCPMSNKWLIDAVDTRFLLHSYTAPARRYGYAYVQTEIVDIDRARRRVVTGQGWIEYDWLVIAGGIRVAYEPWFGNDRRTIDAVKTHYASAYVPNAELMGLKQKIQNFKGGTIVMTLPPPPHRCPPSPYERACLMAWYFRQNKVPTKIVILDPKPRIAPITLGYRQAFEELYPDVITHVPNAGVREVDPFNKVVKTAAGDFRFDDAILMGHHQAADLVWKAGAIGTGADGKPTNWAAVHPQLYNLKDDPRVYVIGDSVGTVSPQFGHYPKSGHVANRMAKSVAKYIAAQAGEREPSPIIIENLCYMLVNNSPREAISVQFDYRLDDKGVLIQTQIDDNERRAKLWDEDLRWYGFMVEDFMAG
jgi:NADH dehydrogenase FAD-containing subunit